MVMGDGVPSFAIDVLVFWGICMSRFVLGIGFYSFIQFFVHRCSAFFCCT